MKDIFHKIADRLPSRVLLNIVFWLLAAWVFYHSNVPQQHVRAITFYKTISIVSLAVFTYINTLVLIPRLLKERHFLGYLSSAAILIVSYAALYSIFILKVLGQYPDIKSYEIVVFSVPMGTGWSARAVWGGTIEYAIIYGIWLFVFTMVWYRHDHARQRSAMLTALQKQTETELSFLKAQINPHFLFNTLNNLYGLALQKSDKSPEAILKLSSVLRYLLYESNTPTVPFEKEKEIIEAYISIELLRLEDTHRLETSVTTDKPCQIPPLLWLPVLENLFKHGARTIAEDNELVFRFQVQDNQLSIYSRNKEKMLVKSAGQSGGIGLSNLEKRLEILYPGAHSISTCVQDNDYIAAIHINLETSWKH